MTSIEQTGWRTACTAIGIVVLVVLAPIDLLLRKRPEDIGIRRDGDAALSASAKPVSYVVDPDWAGIDWDLAARGSHRTFWWLALLSAFAIWMPSPRKIRAVAGQLHRTHASRGRWPTADFAG